MVTRLEGPIAKYTSGAFPSHSVSEKLADNFSGVSELALRFILNKEGWITSEGRPTKKAASDGAVAVLDKTPLWSLEVVSMKLISLGNDFKRKPVNQEVERPSDGQPRWVNLGTLGTYFSASATVVGKWLDDLELRDEEKMATKDAVHDGLATIVEMSTGQGKNKTRKINHWELHSVIDVLKEAGHILNFDYEASLVGRGRNSDVKVDTVDSRARDFAKVFVELFKDKVRRRELPEIVKKTPTPILKKAEELIGRPGFITKDEYRKSLDRD